MGNILLPSYPNIAIVWKGCSPDMDHNQISSLSSDSQTWIKHGQLCLQSLSDLFIINCKYLFVRVIWWVTLCNDCFLSKSPWSLSAHLSFLHSPCTHSPTLLFPDFPHIGSWAAESYPLLDLFAENPRYITAAAGLWFLSMAWRASPYHL